MKNKNKNLSISAVSREGRRAQSAAIAMRDLYFSLSSWKWGRGGSSLLLLALALPVHALEELTDESMGTISGQQGVLIETTLSKASIDEIYWHDMAPNTNPYATTNATGQNMAFWAKGLSMTGNNLGLSLSLDYGSTGGATPAAGFNLGLAANLGTLAGQSFYVCGSGGNSPLSSAYMPGGASANCGSSSGALTIQTNATQEINLKTSNGLFNKNALAEIDAAIENINVYFTQRQSNSSFNQLILRNFNFHFAGKGYIYVDDANGLILESRDAANSLQLVRASDPTYSGKTLPGLNLELMYKAGVGDPSNPATTYNTSGAGGLIRVGASGEIKNGKLQIRGVSTDNITGAAVNTTASVLGAHYSNATTATTDTILSGRGMMTRFSADFTNTGANPTTLELAHAGNYAYGMEFSNLTPLLVRTGCAANGTGCGGLNTAAASFDSGNIYLNLTNSRRLLMPQNSVLNSTRMGGSFMTTAADYSHLVNAATDPNNVPAMVIAVRGMEFNAVSRQGRFIASNDHSPSLPAASTWGLGLPFHDVNINAAFYGKNVGGEERIGGAFALSSKGVSDDGTKTTSILVIDGAPNANDGGNPTNYYLGLRNIDLYMAGYGDIGLAGGKLNINIPQFTLALATQFAGGYLPGSKFKTANRYAPSNSFLSKDDVLFGINLKMAGATELNITPSTNTSVATNYPTLGGSMTLTSGALQIVEPVDGTTLGFDNATGKIGLNNSLRINSDSVDFHAELNLNPDRTTAGMLRFADVNLYPTSASPAQRLGEMVFTGGQLVSNIRIKPF